MSRRTDWKTRYADRLSSPHDAVRLIKAGRRVLISSGAAEPVTLVDALIRYGTHLSDTEIVHLLTLGPAPYVEPAHADRFRHAAFFIGANVRAAVQEGRADFIPVFLSEIPTLIRERRVRIDVALIQVSEPDEHGFVSLGVSVDVVRAAVESADLVIAEVNPNAPRTHGDSFIPISRIHRLVESNTPLFELAAESGGEVEAAIGRYVATLVPDGATIQTGIGQIPDAVLNALARHRDLGVHTEMMSDGMMHLAQQGVVTGARKTLLRGKMVTSFVMGSRALYDWVDDNPAIEMRGSDFTNDPLVIARHDGMISINSALAVDLTGQVAADTLMGKFFSGIGGQVDFVRGASRSRGGKAIIALRSTAKNGSVSRIQPVFEAGAGVVTSRGDVRYVVTEYGIADLWGKSIRERALALIEIAHPPFRAELLAAAKERRYVFPDQRISRAIYPWAEERRENLVGGAEIVVRPVRMSDEEALQRLFYELSEETTYKRFLAHKRIHTHEEMQALCDTDYELSMGLLACDPTDGSIVGIARYDLDPSKGLAEIAFVVRDDWQCRGVGTILMRRAGEIARARGVRGFEARVLATNKPMLMLLHKSGLQVRSRLEEDCYHVEALFADPAP